MRMKKGIISRIFSVIIMLSVMISNTTPVIVTHAADENSIFPVTEDTYVRQTFTSGSDTTPYSTMNYGNSDLLEVADIANANGGGDRITYMKVNLSGYTKSSATSAKLYFYISQTVSPSVNVRVDGLSNDSWSANTVTFSSPPSSVGSVQCGSVRVSAPGWYSIDVTNYLNSQISDKIVSFKIWDPNTAQSLVKINSIDNTENKPYLLIDPSNNADLSNLAISSGSISPAFDAGKTGYSATVASSVYGIKITPVAAESHSSIKVNGIVTASGSASEGIKLDPGSNTVTIEVTAQDNSTKKTYTIEVLKEVGDSAIADLSSLTLSSGSLSPAFYSGITNYTASVISNVDSITVTPTAAESHAAIKVNNMEVSSGASSQSISLSPGDNTITIEVTAQNGDVKDYTVAVNRQLAPSGNADLSSLTLSSGALNPAFAPSVTGYTVNVDNSVSSINITPELADSYATVKINDTTAVSGTAFGPINLLSGKNTVTIEVTAQDNGKKVYTIDVTRMASNNADLAKLEVLQGTTPLTLSPAFGTSTTSYSANVAVIGLTGTGITVKPTLADGNATVKVNNVNTANGGTSDIIPINTGNNIINVEVTAQDGTSKQYKINVIGDGVTVNSHSDGEKVPIGIVRVSGNYVNDYDVKLTVNAQNIYDCILQPTGNESGTWYYDLDTSKFDGPVELYVKGLDSFTRYATVAPLVTLNVDNPPANVPAVTISNPTEMSVVSGIVPITVNVNAKNPLASVHVRVNGGEWNTAEFNGNDYIYNWDTSSVFDKTCGIEAKAEDSLGHESKIKTIYAKVGSGTNETSVVPKQDRAMWIWESASYNLLLNEGSRDVLDAFCKDTATFNSDAITTLYLGVERYKGTDILLDDPAKVREFVSWAHGKGYKVMALIESDMGVAPMASYSRYHYNAERSIEKVINYNISSELNERFDGVNVDIEPYTLPDFNPASPSLQIQYLDMLDKMVNRIRVAGINLPFGPAVAKWFDTSASCLNITWNGQVKTLAQHVQDITDYIAIMDYRDTAGVQGVAGAGIIPQAQGEIDYACSIGKPNAVVIGVETLDIADSGDPESITFREEGRTYMEGQLDLVYAAFGSNPAFGGIAMHHYDSIRALPSTWAPDGLRWTPPEDITQPSGVSVEPSASAVNYQRIDIKYGMAYDNSEIGGYRIYRSTVSGFTPDSSNLAGVSRGLSYSDIGLLPNTTYYYRVTAVDLNGNVGPFSGETMAVTKDTTLKPMIISSMDMAYTANAAKVTLKVADLKTKAGIAASVHGRFTNAAGVYKNFNTALDGTATAASESIPSGWQTGFKPCRLFADGYYWAQAYDTPHIGYILSYNASLSGLLVGNDLLGTVFNDEITQYSTSVANSVYQINITPTAADINAKVTVNGLTVNSGETSENIGLQVGENILTVVVTAQDGSTKRYIVKINRNDNKDKTPGEEPKAEQPHWTQPAPVPVTAPQPVQTPGTINAEILEGKSSGEAKAILTEENIQKAFEQVNAADRVKTLTVEIPEVKGAKAYTLELPADILKSDNQNKMIRINTGLGSITVPCNMINTSDTSEAANISLTIGRADITGFDENTRIKVADRPVIDLSASIDGKTITWNNPNAAVIISIPYNAADEELKYPELITAMYIDSSGKSVPVVDSRYSNTSGSVIFTTNYFGKYAVAYTKMAFNDIGAYTWAQKQIEVLASRGIINGTSENTFTPEAGITRADFTLLLVKTFGLTAATDSNFDDVKPSDYYYEAVGMAKKLGLIQGKDNNRFDPEAELSRQDMMVLVERVMRLTGKIGGTDTGVKLDKFTDRDLMATYAIDPISSLLKEGIVEGDGNYINPLDNTSRAEAAVLIYRIYSSIYKM